MEVELNGYQVDFIFNKERYPCFVGGWGVGKTLCAISRAELYSRSIPGNLGIVFRKTFKSLQDSTVQDFKKYTGMHVDGNRNVTYPNGSVIMFRHLDEIDSINQQNINLGWAYIEQGEELDSDKEFMMLFGRLRRELKPTDEFLKMGMSLRSMWVIANAGDNWIKSLWKDSMIEGGALIEATTYDNAKNLPKDFLDSLEVIKKKKPEMYKQFVLNDWNVSGDQFVLIQRENIRMLEGVFLNVLQDKRVISCDPSMGGDECVIYVFENTKIIHELFLHYNDTMKIVGELIILMEKFKVVDIAVDSIGIGKGIVDRLRELGKNVIAINSAEKATDEEKFYNRRAEIWWHTMEKIQAREVSYFTDEELIKQLTSVRYKVINSNGKIQLEHKDETKKRLQRSPDRADAFVYGLWAIEQVKTSALNLGNFKLKRPVFSGAGGY